MKEEVSKETILSLVKDQQKEIKGLNYKLAKIEEKYMSLFKENKALKKDAAVFEALLEHVLNPADQLQGGFRTKETGTYSLAELKIQWAKQEQERERARGNVVAMVQAEHQELSSKYEQLLSANRSLQARQENTNQERLQALETQLASAQKNCDYLHKEIVDLNALLLDKDTQIKALLECQQQLENMKADALLHQVQNTQAHFALNQDLLFRHTLNQEKDRVLMLRSQVEALEKEKAKENVPMISLITTQQKSVAEKSVQTQENPVKAEVSQMIQSLDQQTGEENKENQECDLDYLRNIIVKYFVYEKGKYYNEADILMQAILSLLKVETQSQELINRAKEQSSLWHSAKNYMSDYISLTKACNPETYSSDKEQHQLSSFQKYLDRLETDEH